MVAALSDQRFSLTSQVDGGPTIPVEILDRADGQRNSSGPAGAANNTV